MSLADDCMPRVFRFDRVLHRDKQLHKKERKKERNKSCLAGFWNTANTMTDWNATCKRKDHLRATGPCSVVVVVIVSRDRDVSGAAHPSISIFCSLWPPTCPRCLPAAARR